MRTRWTGFVAALAVLVGTASLLGPAVGTAYAADQNAADQIAGEQSSQPAPVSREKRVIGAVHTDTVSVYLDDDRLVLDSKADIDIDGDGVVDVGSRLSTQETLFHLKGGATQVPDLPAYAFLGAPGTPIWLAPQTQDHQLIWPGFSTEDPALAGRIDGSSVSLNLVETEGPGAVELYLQSGSTITRTFSSREELPAWQSGVPQHTHMNWVFTAPGTYRLTFEASARVNGSAQTAQNEYVFVVGDLEAHTQSTETTASAGSHEIAAGEELRIDAQVSPADAAGAIQFRDGEGGGVLGHSTVVGGSAVFRTHALPPGEHAIIAEFVPTWSTDFAPSASAPVLVTVTGDVRPRPEEDDVEPVPEEIIATQPPGAGVVVSAEGRAVRAGAALPIEVPAAAGRWVSVWIPEFAPAWRGWVQADLDGRLTVDVPVDADAGEYRVVLKDEDAAFVGWDAFTVTAAPSAPQPGNPAPPPPVPPAPQPVAPAQQCTPGLVLEHGHIDAFAVSAGGGRAVLQIKEDVTGHHVLREAESVLLRVKPSAYRTDIPAGTPGAPSGFVLPLTQNPNLIWPGWDTNRTAASGYSDVSIHITDVSGPGRVFLSSQGSFGNITSLLQGGGYALPGTIREPSPAHTHAQWVFTHEGIYTLRAHAVATNPGTGASLTTAAHTYVFQVGDVPLGDTFCGLHSSTEADSAAVAAAVDAAAAEAVAAEQAAAAEAREEHADGRDALGRMVPAAEAARPSSIADANPTALIALIGGGGLVIGGVAWMTVWYLRRLRRDELALLGAGS